MKKKSVYPKYKLAKNSYDKCGFKNPPLKNGGQIPTSYPQHLYGITWG
jgi:hypothetical protein